MKYQFKQAMNFEHEGKGHTFPLGIHEVPKHVQSHPFFAHALKHGVICEVGKDQEVKPIASALEHAKNLDEKFSKKPEEKAGKKKG